MTGALCTMQPRVYVVMCVYREHVLWEILVKKSKKLCVVSRNWKTLHGDGDHRGGDVWSGGRVDQCERCRWMTYDGILPFFPANLSTRRYSSWNE